MLGYIKNIFSYSIEFTVYQFGVTVTWWGPARGPWFLSPALGEYVHVQASAEKRRLGVIFHHNQWPSMKTPL